MKFEASEKGCETIVSPDGWHYVVYHKDAFSGPTAWLHQLHDSRTDLILEGQSVFDQPFIKFSSDSGALLCIKRVFVHYTLGKYPIRNTGLSITKYLIGIPTDFDMSADGRFLVIALTVDVVIYDAVSFAELTRIKVDDLRNSDPIRNPFFIPKSDPIRVSFSVDGERLMIFQKPWIRISKWRTSKITWDMIPCTSQKVILTSLNELLFYGGQPTSRKPLDSRTSAVHFDWSSDSVTCSHDSRYIGALFGNQARFYDYETGQLKGILLQIEFDCHATGFMVSFMLFNNRSHNHYVCLEGQYVSAGGQTYQNNIW